MIVTARLALVPATVALARAEMVSVLEKAGFMPAGSVTDPGVTRFELRNEALAFDEGLAARLHELLEDRRGISEKKMFGGIAFMCRGYMFVGIVGDKLMARVGPERYLEALKRPHVRVMDFTGTPMRGYVYVDPPGYESDDDLTRWLDECFTFVGSLPAK